MSPDARAFLDGVRHAEDPTPEDERRVLSAVRATLAAGTGVGAGVFAAKTKLFGVSGISALKLGGLLSGLSAAVWMVGSALPRGAADSPPRVSPPSKVSMRERPAVMKGPASVDGAIVAPEPPARPMAPRAPRTRSTPPAPSLREEIVLLADVRSALERGDGAAALRRLDEHVTSDRQLVAERNAARILALCSLGRTDEARQAAAEFSRQHPTSVQRTAIERSCAGGGRGAER